MFALSLNRHLPKHLCSKHLYYHYKYNSKIEESVNRQIQVEQQAAQEYLNIAVSFLHTSRCFYGAGGFFKNMYKEELQHMIDFIHYQILRGGRPLICGLEAPVQNENLTLLEAFKRSLDMEERVTKQIEKLIQIAEEAKDYECVDFLTSKFLAEQVRSMHEMASHVTKLSQLKDCEPILYYYDLQLAKMYPYSFNK